MKEHKVRISNELKRLKDTFIVREDESYVYFRVTYAESFTGKYRKWVKCPHKIQEGIAVVDGKFYNVPLRDVLRRQVKVTPENEVYPKPERKIKAKA